MGDSRKSSVVIGFVALAAAAFLVLFLVMGVEPEPETPPVEEIASQEIVPVPAAQSAALEVLREPEPVPVPEPVPEEAEEPPATSTDKPPLRVIHTVKDDQPPPLKIQKPRDQSYVMDKRLLVRARSEAGARIEVDGKPLEETSVGTFAGEVDLKPGENQLSISSRDAVGNTSSTTLRVTYVEPRRIRRVKTRFTALLGQLEEVQSTAEEIDHRTELIISRIEYMQDADMVNQLSKELREIRNARRELHQEIEKAIGEIDVLLAKHK